MMTSDHVRRIVDAAVAGSGVVLGSADGAWTTRGVPLAPFPARFRIETERGLLWHDVVVAEVVPPVALEPAVEGVGLPRPEVRLMVGEARWLVAISYPLPFERCTTSEVLGLLAAGPLYAAALATELAGHFSTRWRATLDERGFVVGVGLPGDPRELLRNGDVVPWPELSV